MGLLGYDTQCFDIGSSSPSTARANKTTPVGKHRGHGRWGIALRRRAVALRLPHV